MRVRPLRAPDLTELWVQSGLSLHLGDARLESPIHGAQRWRRFNMSVNPGRTARATMMATKIDGRQAKFDAVSNPACATSIIVTGSAVNANGPAHRGKVASESTWPPCITQDGTGMRVERNVVISVEQPVGLERRRKVGPSGLQCGREEQLLFAAANPDVAAPVWRKVS